MSWNPSITCAVAHGSTFSIRRMPLPCAAMAVLADGNVRVLGPPEVRGQLDLQLRAAA